MAGMEKEGGVTMVYKWCESARYSVDAQVVGDVCEDLDNKGELTAQNLVNVSRPESAPLHGMFNWNDAEAAELYRVEQGRHIIRCLVTVPENNEATTRAYYNIVTEERKYHSINTILREPDKYAELMKSALKELQVFRKKYAVLNELKPVFDAIDDVTE